MIQQIISSTQKLPAPYLGPSKLVELPAQNFRSVTQQLTQQAAPASTPLQSASQHLQIQVKNQAQLTQNQAQQKFNHSVKQLAKQLSQTTRAHLQQHPVRVKILELNLQELLLLSALRAKGQAKAADQLVPSQFAMLSSVPIERSFLRTLPKKREIFSSGRYFMNFRFVWEDWEEEEHEREGQHPQGEQAQDSADEITR